MIPKQKKSGITPPPNSPDKKRYVSILRNHIKSEFSKKVDSHRSGHFQHSQFGEKLVQPRRRPAVFARRFVRVEKADPIRGRTSRDPFSEPAAFHQTQRRFLLAEHSAHVDDFGNVVSGILLSGAHDKIQRCDGDHGVVVDADRRVVGNIQVRIESRAARTSIRELRKSAHKALFQINTISNGCTEKLSRKTRLRCHHANSRRFSRP